MRGNWRWFRTVNLPLATLHRSRARQEQLLPTQAFALFVNITLNIHAENQPSAPDFRSHKQLVRSRNIQVDVAYLYPFWAFIF